MKLTVILTIAGVAAAASSKPRAAGCNADNCLRGKHLSPCRTRSLGLNSFHFIGIRNTARPGLADCMGYFRTTVTPSTVYGARWCPDLHMLTYAQHRVRDRNHHNFKHSNNYHFCHWCYTDAIHPDYPPGTSIVQRRYSTG